MESKGPMAQDVYKMTIETWRYEVDSYWQRNNYFAAFETAALAGCWYVVEHGHWWTGMAFSTLGLLSAIIWFITSLAVHKYVDYWWSAIKKIEQKLALNEIEFDFATRHTGSGLHPSAFVLTVPWLFALAWLSILVFSIVSLYRCLGH